MQTPTEIPTQPSTVPESTEGTRYTKEQLLDVYKNSKVAGNANGDVAHLLHPDFDPWHVNGANSRASWGKSTDAKDANSPNVCWDKQGTYEPISLQPMSEEEKAVGHPEAPFVLLLTMSGFCWGCEFSLETPATEREQGCWSSGRERSQSIRLAWSREHF